MELGGAWAWDSLARTALRIVVILALGAVLLRALRPFLKHLETRLLKRTESVKESPWEAQKRVQTLTALLQQGAAVVVWVTLALVILTELGVKIGPILASAGVLGLAIGFGAQNLVKDVIAGFFMILENQVRVGDVVTVNGVSGLVERMHFRTLVLRDLGGVVHIFPNGGVTTLANQTRDWSAYVFSVALGPKEDLDRAVAMIREVVQQLRADSRLGPLIIDDPEIFGVDELGDGGMTVEGRIRTRPIKQWEVGREFLRELGARAARQGIEIKSAKRA